MGTILGVAALALALVGVGIGAAAYVHTGPAGPTGPTGATGAPATSLWAVVNATGVLLNSSHVTSASEIEAGGYQVIFTQNVRNCSYIATLGIPGSVGMGQSPPGFVTTAGRDGEVDGVWVATFNETGVQTDEPFNLAVFC